MGAQVKNKGFIHAPALKKPLPVPLDRAPGKPMTHSAFEGTDLSLDLVSSLKHPFFPG